MKCLFCAAGFLLIMTSVVAQEILTIETAVQRAMDNNLSLKRSALDVGTRQRAADRSWNTLIPTLSASVGASHPTSVTGYNYGSSDVWSPGLYFSAGITLSTSIVDNIKKAQTDYEQGLLSYESAKLELELQVRKLFYQILLLEANCELAAQNLASAESRYEQSAALVRLGQAPRLDELSARVDMENLRPPVRSAQMVYENVLDSFKTILGFPLETEIGLSGSLSGGITEGFLDNHDTAGESLEAAALRKSIQSMELQQSAIRNEAHTPYLRLSWDTRPLFDTQNNWKLNDRSGSFNITLGINLDNFLPWSSAKTRIEDISDSITSAQMQLSDALRNRENKINQNMRTLGGTLDSLEAMKLNVELAQTTYDMYAESYRRGATDYQQLRGAGDSLEQTKNRLLQEQYNLIVALLDLEKELNLPFGTLFIEGE